MGRLKTREAARLAAVCQRGGHQCKQVVMTEKNAKAFTTLDENKDFVANKTHMGCYISRGQNTPGKENICAFSDETKGGVQSQEPL
jgi:hypothetical protein